MLAPLLALALAAAGDPDLPRVPPTPAERAFHAGVAVFPGVLVPGLGHRMADEPQTARVLLTTSLSGLGALLVGGTALIVTGGTADLGPVYYPLIFCGATAFLSSWLADVAGAARPEGWAAPLDRELQLRLALRYGLRRDTYSAMRHLGALEAGWESRRLLLFGEAWWGPGSGYGELRARGGYKLWSDVRASHLALLVEAARRTGPVAEARAYSGAGLLELRLDLRYLGPSLAGLVFVQRVGFGALASAWPDGAPARVEGLVALDFELSLPVAKVAEVGLVYTQRPDARLGFFGDHAGMAGLTARTKLGERLRATAQFYLGAGVEALAGVEAVW